MASSVSVRTRSLVLGPGKAGSNRPLQCVDGCVSAHLALTGSLVNGGGSHSEGGKRGEDYSNDKGAVNKEMLAGTI